MRLATTPTLGVGPHGKWGSPSRSKSTDVQHKAKEGVEEMKPKQFSTKLKPAQTVAVVAVTTPHSRRSFAGFELHSPQTTPSQPREESLRRQTMVYLSQLKKVTELVKTELPLCNESIPDVQLYLEPVVDKKPTLVLEPMTKNGGDTGSNAWPRNNGRPPLQLVHLKKTAKSSKGEAGFDDSDNEASNYAATKPDHANARVPSRVTQRASYACIERRPSLQFPTKTHTQLQRGASFTNIELKRSANGGIVKNGGDPILPRVATPNLLPDMFFKVALKDSRTPLRPEVDIVKEAKPEYSNVRLKDSSTPVKPEVEVPKEHALDYSSVPLRHATVPVKPELEVLVEKKFDYSAVRLTTSARVKNSTVLPTRFSFKEVQRDGSGYGNLIRCGGDRVKDSSHSSDLEPSFAAVLLKESGYGNQIKSGGDIMKRPVTKTDPSVSTIQPKDSSHRQVVKEKDSTDRHALPIEFAGIQLKRADRSKTQVGDILEEDKIDYRATPLMPSGNFEKFTAYSNKHTLPEEFDWGQLHYVDRDIPQEISVLFVENQNYSIGALKPTTPYIKNPGAPIASYAKVTLKKSGYGDAIECGGNIYAEPKDGLTSAYTAVQLKPTGQGEEIKKGKDAAKEKVEVREKHMLPIEFAAVQLKKACAPVKTEIEPLPKQVLEYTTVRLKKPDTPLKPEIEPIPKPVPEYTSIQLKPSKKVATKPEVASKAGVHNILAEQAVVQLNSPDRLMMDMDVFLEQGRDHGVVPMKHAEHVEKHAVRTRRAYHLDLQEKASIVGDSINSGGDAAEKPAEEEMKPSYFVVKLKSTDNGDALKSGGDVAKKCAEIPKVHRLPAEFGAIERKTAATRHIQPELELLPEQESEYLKAVEPVEKNCGKTNRASCIDFVALKAAKTVEKPAVISKRAFYGDLELKKVGHSPSKKSSGELLVQEALQSQEDEDMRVILKSRESLDAVKGDIDGPTCSKDLPRMAPHLNATNDQLDVKPRYAGVHLRATGRNPLGELPWFDN